MKRLLSLNSAKPVLLATALILASSISSTAFVLEIKCGEDITNTLSDSNVSIKAGKVHLLQRHTNLSPLNSNKYRIIERFGKDTALQNGTFIAYISRKNLQQIENVVVIKAYNDKLVNDNGREEHFKKSYPGQKVKMRRNYLFGNQKTCKKKSSRAVPFINIVGMFQKNYPLSNYVAHHRSISTNLNTKISDNHFYYRRSETKNGYNCVATDGFTQNADNRSAYRLDNKKATFDGRFIASVNDLLSATRAQAQTNNRVVAQVLHHRFKPKYNMPTCIHFSLSNTKQIISLTVKELESDLGFQWKRD